MRHARNPAMAACLIIAGLLGAAAAVAEPRAIVGSTAHDPDPPPFSLALPIDCEVGVSCWVFKYVDVDPGEGVSDFSCGTMTHPGHKGTDFALPHRGWLERRVAVRAAAEGTVKAIRDELPDVEHGMPNSPDIAGREGGNGVLLDHGRGWTTQYCHLGLGSVRVSAGEAVRQGAQIGEVGMSGLTNFPHLHFTVRRDGKVVDPFVGISDRRRCAPGRAPLWRDQALARLPYRSAIIYNAGFADDMPDVPDIRSGALSRTVYPVNTRALVFWAEMAGLKTDDHVAMRLTDPAGKLIASRSERTEEDQVRIWLAVGVRVSDATWRPGSYRGDVTITRDTEAGPVRSWHSTFVVLE